MLRRGGCEGRGVDESMRSEHVDGGCGWGRSWRDGVGRRLLVGGRGKVPIETSRAIPIQSVSQPRRFCENQPESERSRRSAPTWNRWSTLVSSYLPRESTWSRGNVGGPEVDVIDKSQAVAG